MHELTKLIREDMKPALGVTEPGAIAFAAAKARSCVPGEVESVAVSMNSGMYKNAFTCGIPGTDQVGSVYAAALGTVAGDPEKGLECLACVSEEDNAKARELIREGKVKTALDSISSRIFIEADVTTEAGTAVVTIQDTHTNIVKITVNGKTVFEKAQEMTGETAGEKAGEETEVQTDSGAGGEAHAIHSYTLAELVDYIEDVDAAELDFIREAYEVNLKLCQLGLESPKTTFARHLLKLNGGQVISDNEQATASLLCNGAIEARVIGLDAPAMSITGSGAHGIIATMPLYAAYRVNGYPEEQLLRATALSYLVCMYIKEYSGRLSAFCGCAIAAGSGMACGLVWLRGGTVKEMAHTLNNMASSITGMICDGGNQGCTMKGIAAVDAAYKSVEFAMNGIYIADVHGINGETPEETMRNMGRIASPGMTGTEKTIVEIFDAKQKKRGGHA